jgi:hypothetical protein
MKTIREIITENPGIPDDSIVHRYIRELAKEKNLIELTSVASLVSSQLQSVAAVINIEKKP